MPIPNPTSKESKDEYVSRCIDSLFDEYGEEQSAAICINKWEENRLSKPTEVRVLSKILNIYSNE